MASATEITASTVCTALKPALWLSVQMFQMRVPHTQIVQIANTRSRLA